MTADERQLMWVGMAAIRFQNQILRERGELTVGDRAIEGRYQDWCDREEAIASSREQQR
jgi:hypothetical protein